MDKETLKKHHFWILLIPFFILAIVLWVGLWTSVADATSERLKDITKHTGNVEATSKSAKSQFLRDGLEEQKKELLDRRTDMWKKAWEKQQDIYTFPKEFPDNDRAMLENLSFGVDIKDLDLRAQYRTENYYVKEYDKLVKEVQPMQFNGGWKAILKHVDRWAEKRVPESEDIWLAQEDFWVQRELVRVAHEVNQKAAVFTEVGKSEDALNRKFANRFWEIELKVITDGKGDQYLTGKLKNITNRLQVFGINNEMILQVYLDASKDEFPFYFPIEGNFLQAGESKDIKQLPKHRLTKRVNELARVVQVFDGRTIPVKRIDRIAMGYASSRTVVFPLKMATFSQKIIDDEAAKAATDSTATGSTVSPMGAAPPPPSSGGEMTSGGANSALATDRSNAGLDRKRYINLTAQVRRMPVGMVLILDQNFLPDVLESLTNSKLRFQNSQYHWKRFKAAGLSYGGPASMTGSSVPSGGGDITPTFSPMFPMGSGSGTTNTVSTNRDPLSASMIELSVYGIASLYEKFDPNAQTATTPETKTPETKTPETKK